MGRQNIFHILHSHLLFRNHAPGQVIRIWGKFCIGTVPYFGLWIQGAQHMPCTRGIVNMVGIVMASECIPWIQHTVQGKIQVIFADKFLQICRAHIFQISIFLACALISWLILQRFFQVKLVDSELIWHYYIHIIRNPSCHPVMSADGLQPPDLVLILECNSVHLVGSVFFQNASKAGYSFTSTVDIGKNNGYNIFLSDSAGDFLSSVCCWLIYHQRICTKYTGVGGDSFGSSHSHICLIDTTCSPDALALYRVWDCGVTHGILWEIDLHMGNHRFIFSRLLLWMDHQEFFRHIMSGTGIIVSGDHGRAIVGRLFSN